jgi:secreted Zn-dependent insulinase-like peptidase
MFMDVKNRTDHVEDIVGIVFKYIALLKDSGIHKWIFDEVIN